MTGPFAESVLEQIVAAGEREQRTRRRRWGAAIAAAVAAVTGSVIALAPGPVTADVEITEDAGWLEVTITDGRTTVDEVVEAFQEVGVAAEVSEGAAGPSDVGRFVLVVAEGRSAEQVRSTRAGATTAFRIREGYSGVVLITIGRPARAGEPYAVASDASAEGEPLHCAGVLGRPLAEVVDAVAAFDVRVLVQEEGNGDGALPLADVVAARPTYVVAEAQAFSATDLVLFVEPVAPYGEPGC